MATIAAGRNGNNTAGNWGAAFQSYETPSGAESQAAMYSGTERWLAWRAGSEYIKGITPMPITTDVELSPYLILARRRAIWKGVTPVAFTFMIASGIAAASAGLPIMIPVMALTLVVTATVGYLVWPS